MNIEELWKAALTHSLENAAMVFAIPVKSDKGELIQFQSLNIDTGLGAALRSMINDFRNHLLSDAGQKRVIEFTPDYKPDNYDVEWVSADNDLIKAIVETVPQLASIPFVADLKKATHETRFYALIFELPNGERTLFMRRFERSKIMRPSSNLVIRVLGDRFSRLEEPTLQIDDQFDAIYFRGHVFSLHKNNFLYMFRFYEALRKYAGKVFHAITERIPIKNAGEFEAVCLGNIHMMSKLRNISRKSYLEQVSMEDLRVTIANNKLNIKIEVDGAGRECLVFDAAHRWDILHLLDDRYLESRMTKNRYEANSKRELK